MTTKSWEGKMESIQQLFDSAHPFERGLVSLSPSGVSFPVDVARSPEQRARGMVGRTFDDDVRAMLFIEPVETYAKFHMKDVADNLVLVIFDSAGLFIEALRMRANSTTIVHACSFKYALEMSPEFFDSLDLDGQTLTIKG